MSPKLQRIAIARACPLVARIDGAGVPVWVRNSREEFDPLEDLNAMHEAEKVLREKGDFPAYSRHLISVCTRDYPSWPVLHATAAQRAEAFLRTLGEWKDAA